MSVKKPAAAAIAAVRVLVFAAYDREAPKIARVNEAFVFLRNAILTTEEKARSATEWAAGKELLEAFATAESEGEIDLKVLGRAQPVRELVTMLKSEGASITLSTAAFSLLERIWKARKKETSIGQSLIVDEIDRIISDAATPAERRTILSVDDDGARE